MNTNTLARIATAGVSAFFVIMYIAFLFIQPELNPLERWGSEYAVGPMGWLMVTAFVCLATAIAALALGMARGLDGHSRSRIGIVLLAIAALGILLGGVFDSDPQVLNENPPPRWVEPSTPTPEGTGHILAGIVAFFTLMPGAFVISRRLHRAGRLGGGYQWLRYLSWLAPVAFVAIMVVLEPRGLEGLGQRIFLAIILVWMLLAARGLGTGAFASN